VTSERTVLDMFGVDLDFLTKVVKANPSLRGIIIGYLAERKLWDLFAADSRITAIRKDDDHDRDNKGDVVVTYQGFDFRFEVKSLQTNSIRMLNPSTGKWMPKIIGEALPPVQGKKRQKKKWVECELYRDLWQKGGAAAKFSGKVQCDASDKREITWPSGQKITTTNLRVGEFDILAMGLFAFREQWDFGFVLNRDLPRPEYRGYSAEDRKHLLKTLIPVGWPLPAKYESDPFTLLDMLAAERRPTKPATDTSGRR
jgi:hypothetical protein